VDAVVLAVELDEPRFEVGAHRTHDLVDAFAVPVGERCATVSGDEDRMSNGARKRSVYRCIRRQSRL
jgi:hypothetical protein